MSIDFDLPELAFVGLDTAEISKRLGSAYFIKDSCRIYSQNNAVLILKINGKKVEWLKYELLKESISKDHIPIGLLKWE